MEDMWCAVDVSAEDLDGWSLSMQSVHLAFVPVSYIMLQQLSIGCFFKVWVVGFYENMNLKLSFSSAFKCISSLHLSAENLCYRESG